MKSGLSDTISGHDMQSPWDVIRKFLDEFGRERFCGKADGRDRPGYSLRETLM
jgi:hypothetical protein